MRQTEPLDVPSSAMRPRRTVPSPLPSSIKQRAASRSACATDRRGLSEDARSRLPPLSYLRYAGAGESVGSMTETLALDGHFERIGWGRGPGRRSTRSRGLLGRDAVDLPGLRTDHVESRVQCCSRIRINPRLPAPCGFAVVWCSSRVAAPTPHRPKTTVAPTPLRRQTLGCPTHPDRLRPTHARPRPKPQSGEPNPTATSRLRSRGSAILVCLARIAPPAVIAITCFARRPVRPTVIAWARTRAAKTLRARPTFASL